MCFPFELPNPVEATAWFARAFHDSAQREAHELAGRDFADYEALPAVFLFRHAAELYLKSIVWNADKLLAFLNKPTSGAPGPSKANHTLSSWLPYLNHVLQQLELKWDDKFGPFANVEVTLKQLAAADPGSYSFRYPMKKDGGASHDPEFGFNLVVFARTIDPVLEGLWDISGDLENLHEHHMIGD